MLDPGLNGNPADSDDRLYFCRLCGLPLEVNCQKRTENLRLAVNSADPHDEPQCGNYGRKLTLTLFDKNFVKEMVFY